MSVARRIAKNIGALTVARAAVLGLNFVTWVHLARVLAPDAYGVLSFGLALLAYFLLTVSLGFDKYTVREIARDKATVRDLVSDVLSARLTLALLSSIVYGTIVVLLHETPEATWALALMGAQLLVQAIRLDWVYQGIERMGIIAARDATASALTATVVLAFVREPSHLPLAALALVGAPLLSNASLFIAYARDFGMPRLRVDRPALRALFAASIPLAAASFVSEIYYSLDRLMLEAIRTTAEVGLYGAAYKVLGLALAPSAILSPAFFPALSTAYGDAAAMRQRSRSFARFMLASGVPLVVVAPFIATDLLTLLYGDLYAEAAAPLMLLLANGSVMYIAMTFGIPLLAWNRQVAYMRAVLVGGGANVILNVALIAPYGPTGAALATLLSEFAVLLAIGYIFSRETGHAHVGLIIHACAVAILGAGLPAAAAWFLGWPLWALISAVLVGYPLVAVGAGLLPYTLIRRFLQSDASSA
ncbi:MAG: flippase [Bacteroidota bacterium]